MLPVADAPILAYVLALLRGHGVTEVCVNLHHHAEQIRAALEGKVQGVALTFSEEPVILGTGGALKKMGDWLTRGGKDNFLVMNGKLITNIDLSKLMQEHEARRPLATLVVREVADAQRWGAIDVAEDGRVTDILGAGRHMFTGVHVVSPALVGRLPEGVSCSIRQGYLPALREEPVGKNVIYSHLYKGYFQEHSTPARYLEGNFAVVRGEAQLDFPPAPTSGVAPTAKIARDVRLVGAYLLSANAIVEAGATIGPDAIVGAGARVAADVQISRVVVWPGAVVDKSITDAIVTPRGVHPVEGNA